MLLTPEMENQLVEQNLPKIYRAVDNFMSRCNNVDYAPVQIPYDDCVQEVSIAFLKYVRRCESADQLEKFPWYDALHALSEFVLRCQPVNVPISTKKFSSLIHSIPATVSYEVLASTGIDIDGMSKHWVPDADTKLDFDSFMADQPENVQRIAAMKILGMWQSDIAAQFGVSQQYISKRISKLREDYDEYTKEDEDDE